MLYGELVRRGLRRYWTWESYRLTLNDEGGQVDTKYKSPTKITFEPDMSVDACHQALIRIAKIDKTDLQVKKALEPRIGKEIVLLVPAKHKAKIYDVRRLGKTPIETTLIIDSPIERYAAPEIEYVGVTKLNMDGSAQHRHMVSCSLDWYIYRPEQYLTASEIFCVQCNNEVCPKTFQAAYVRGHGLRCGACLDYFQDNGKEHLFDREGETW